MTVYNMLKHIMHGMQAQLFIDPSLLTNVIVEEEKKIVVTNNNETYGAFIDTYYSFFSFFFM
jgi:hypothetical protein